MIRGGCQRAWEIDAYRQGSLAEVDRASFERHLAACERCVQQIELDDELRRLGRMLPTGRVDDLHARRLRAKVLYLAATPPERERMPLLRRPGLGLAVAVLLVLTVLALGVRRRRLGGPTETAVDGSPLAQVDQVIVEAAPDTVWERVHEGLIDRVKLKNGQIALRVKLLAVGSRFIVELPDGDLEVRGTTFIVAVSDDETRRVEVSEGRVELHLRGQEAITVDASTPWSRAPIVAPTTSQSRTDAAPAVATPKLARQVPAATEITDDELDYVDAMESYESGRFEEAARRFHDFGARAAGAPESEDAIFLEAVSLARAGRGEASAAVAEQFLSRYPSSIHGKDAALLVARAARIRGDCKKASTVVSPWLGSTRDAAVSRALGSCDAAHPPPAR